MKYMKKKWNGSYTRMQRAVLNKSWKQRPVKQQLYGRLPPISQAIQVKQTRYAGHCCRSFYELIGDVLLWTPSCGRVSVGQSTKTYMHQLCMDTGWSREELPGGTDDINIWRERETMMMIIIIFDNDDDFSFASEKFNFLCQISLSLGYERNGYLIIVIGKAAVPLFS